MSELNPLAGFDEYELRQLVGHLVANRRHGDLFRLLDLETADGRNALHEAKRALDHTGVGYLTDAEAAWAAAERLDQAASEHGERPAYLGRETLSALAITSARGLTGNVPAPLLVTLLRSETWTPDEILDAVARNPDSRARADALAALAQHLPEGLREEALGVARDTPDPGERARALAGLAAAVDEPARGHLAEEALRAARGVPEPGARVEALAGAIAPAAEPARSQAVREAFDAVWIVARAAPVNQGDRVQSLIDLATVLVDQLAEPSRSEVRDEVLEAARSLETSPYSFAPMFRQMLRARPSQAPGERLQTSMSFGNNPRGYVIARLAAGAPDAARDALIEEALGTTEEEDGVLWAPRLRIAVAAILSEPRRTALLRETLDDLRNYDEAYGGPALLAVAPLLPVALLPDALATARRLESETARARVLAALAPSLSDAPLRDAIAATDELSKEEDQAIALATLLPRLALADAVAATARVESIESPAAMISVVAALAPSLPARWRRQVFARALAAARAVPDATGRARLLTSLLPCAPRPRRNATVREALQAVGRHAAHPGDRGAIVERLVQYLSPPLLGPAFGATQAVGDAVDRGSRAVLLGELARYVPESLRTRVLDEALDLAGRTDDALKRAPAFAFLCHRLADAVRPREALEAARQIGSGQLPPSPFPSVDFVALRARELVSLARELPEPYGDQALREAAQLVPVIARPGERVQILAALAEQLPDPTRGAILQQALAMTRQLAATRAAARTLSWQQEHDRAQQFGRAPDLDRSSALDDAHVRGWAQAAAALAPHLAEPERSDVLRGILDALSDVGLVEHHLALINLAPRLPGPLLREAIEAEKRRAGTAHPVQEMAILLPRLAALGEGAEALAAARDVPAVLAAIVPFLDDDQLQEALSTARASSPAILAAVAETAAIRLAELGLGREALGLLAEVPAAANRGRVLAAQVRYLSGSMLLEAIEAAWALEDRSAWPALLAALPPAVDELPADRLYVVWRGTLRLAAADTRTKLLAGLLALLPLLRALGGPSAAAEVADALQKTGVWWP